MPTRDRRDQPEARRSSSVPTTRRESYLDRGSSDPFSQFRRLSDQMERWFENVAGLRRGDRGGMGLWAPEIETFMRGDQFVVRVDLPGLKKNEVNIEAADDSLVIHGERQNTHEEEREGFYRTERVYGRFYREIPLPEGALSETAQADFKDGVLEITVTAPPREVSRPRRIEIGGGPSSASRGSTAREPD